MGTAKHAVQREYKTAFEDTKSPLITPAAEQPYSFGYDNVDEFGTKTYHKEQGDASNAKTGSFGYTDASGLFRRVNYVADAGGFRAQVDTNEPGTLPGASADAVFNSNPRPAGGGRYASPYTAGGGFGGPGPRAG
ncbi:hypothetical protein HPB48_017701 [Haemaphysalis longicornis]|uniref:Cuticle protein n=1 Tax=Haemaphysalis longicornis TaxID=44386 RepID=A0A9J6G8J1_HAELO|nr:hypothetical protein HPB48_017701 [Haemaphysalis longicornis]